MLNAPPLPVTKLKSLRKLHQKKYRSSYNKYLCEGKRIFKAAAGSARCTIREIIYLPDAIDPQFEKYILRQARRTTAEIYAATGSDIKQLSSDITSPGLIFTVDSTLKANNQMAKLPEGTVLFLDRISDPGNLGTIIRTAVWFGVTTLFLSPGCVDPQNAKAVRASAGALFECDLYTDFELEEILSKGGRTAYRILAAIPHGKITLTDLPVKKNNLLMLGSEADGLDEAFIEHTDVLVTIPGSGLTESLNVAVTAGIFLNFLQNPAGKKSDG